MSEVQSPKSKLNDSTDSKNASNAINASGACLWFTGLPCCGKTTVADLVAQKLKHRGRKVERLDGDIVRKSLTKDLGFSKEDRNKNIERITFVSKLLSRNGVFVLTSFISPYIKKREHAREETTNFIEIYVKASVEECKKRDIKGMYEKAIKGEIKNFTGISDPYEEPPEPEIVLDTEKESVEESAQKVIRYLKEHNFI